MGKQSRACVIGLDGATFSLLDRWVATGDMPHLGELMERGTRAELISTIPPVTGPAWTSMTTGVSPGQHGIFDFVKWKADGITHRLAQSGDCTVPRLWDVIGGAGRRVGAFQVPVTYPAWPVNGFMVTGMLTPAPGRDMTYPASLYEVLAERELAWFPVRVATHGPLEYARLTLEAHRRSDQAMRLALEQYRPDFFMCVCGGVDHLQHYLWPYCTADGDAPDARILDAVRQYFRALDDTIGFLKGFFGDGTTYYVVSDHGLGPVRKAWRVNNYLARQGFLRLRRGRLWRARAVFGIARQAKRLFGVLGLLGPARAALRKFAGKGGVRLSQWGRQYALLATAVDWSRTRACAKSRSDCGIHVNVRGRCGHGIVEPGPQYEKVMQDLMRALDAATDPETGEKLVGHILRREEVHSGRCVDEAPDLTFFLRGSDMAVDTSLGGPLFCDHSMVATHRMEGVLVASGPGVKGGTEAPARIVDVAPTVLHGMGLPVPRYMEGDVLTRLLRDDYVRRHPVRYAEATLDESRKEPGWAATDQERDRAVQERLRDMGYL